MTMIQHRDTGDENEAAMTDDSGPLYYAVADGDDYRRVLAMTDERAAVELDLSAGGFPESTFVGKNTSVADVAAELVALRAENTELSARVSELTRLLGEAEEALREFVRLRSGGTARGDWVYIQPFGSPVLVQKWNLPAVNRALESVAKSKSAP